MLRAKNLRERGKAIIRNSHYADIWINGGKGIIGGEHLIFGQRRNAGGDRQKGAGHQPCAKIGREDDAIVGAAEIIHGHPERHGQDEGEATEHLNLMNKMGPLPWKLGFSYGRALQHSSLTTWAGKSANVAAAQRVLAHRSKMNWAAATGKYTAEMEKAA